MNRAFALALLGLSFGLPACDVAATTTNEKPGVEATDDNWVRPAGPTPVEAHGQLSVMGPDLVNKNGDPVQLKGVSSMWLNWENDGYAENPQALVWMRDHWGLSVIRAAMGIDPAGAYLADPAKAKRQVRTIVDNAIAAGVYVIIDWHDHNAPAHVNDAVAFFTEMAQAYAGVPNVIYETFNEPVNLTWPGEIKPYHETVVAAIRAVEPNSVIILGTPNYSQDVDIAAASPLEGNNLMYTLHFYSCTHGGYLMSKLQAARSKGLPMFVTEWGATHADGGRDGKVCLTEAAQWMDLLKAAKVGWAAWKLDNCTPDSTCLVASGAPLTGGWTTEYLHGHAPFVRDAMRE
ncbi:MAG: glycoside hydrolase family 5 protein [Myxococcota bacterium]